MIPVSGLANALGKLGAQLRHIFAKPAKHNHDQPVSTT